MDLAKVFFLSNKQFKFAINYSYQFILSSVNCNYNYAVLQLKTSQNNAVIIIIATNKQKDQEDISLKCECLFPKTVKAKIKWTIAHIF